MNFLHLSRTMLFKPHPMLALAGMLAFCFLQISIAAPQWHPRADDLCGEYVAKLSKPQQYGDVGAPDSDPAIARYIADFNALNGGADRGGMAMTALMVYCISHAATKVGDVTARAVIEDIKPSGQEHSTPQTAPPPTSQSATLQCLQDVARRTSELARTKGYSGTQLYDMVGEAQRMLCGYSAINPDPASQPQARPPQTDTVCFADCLKRYGSEYCRSRCSY